MNTYSITCPVCARSFDAASEADPVPMPCVRCWGDLSPAQKAPFIRALRAVPPERRMVPHRDPVTFAPPTLAAYVELLEAELRGGAR